MSQIENLELEVEETHRQVSKSDSFKRGRRALNSNVGALERSLKTTRRKYRQARITINQMINEQNQLFSSRLNEIDTKLQVIHALYDYFKVLTTTLAP